MPLVTDEETLPLLNPHVASVGDNDNVGPAMFVMDAVADTVQPAASVIVIV